MTARSAKGLFAHGWLYVPAAAGPIGGGMIKIGGGSSWAAVTVGAAPYVVCLLLDLVFVIGYLAALTRYLCSGHAGQEAMERLITVSANAVVAILTLKRAGLPDHARPHAEFAPNEQDGSPGRLTTGAAGWRAASRGRER